MALSSEIIEGYKNYWTIAELPLKRQAYWQNTTKPLLIQVLNSTSQELAKLGVAKTPLEVKFDESDKNFDWIGLGFFRPIPTQIVLQQGNGVVGCQKLGGTLAYAQLPNGKVHIEIQLTYIEPLQDKEFESLGEVNPEEITEKEISRHIELFLRKISEHEDKRSFGKASRGKLGF